MLLQVSLLAQNDNENNNKDKKKKYEFEKSKTYSKSYNVSGSDKIVIDNKFGDVEVHTWAKNEIKVDVVIKASAKTEEWATSVLSDIEIEDSKSGNQVKFKTLFSEDLDKKEGGSKHQDKYKNKNSNQSMDIDYTVYMPASNPLDIDNQFGAITLPDYSGQVDLTSKFGSLTTGKLSDVKALTVEFGKAKIESAANGTIAIKFSSAEMGKLVGNIKLTLEFSKATKINLDNGLTGLDAKVSYSTVNLKPSGDFSASYNISTSFGSFKNKTNIKFDGGKDDEERGPKFDFEYSGKSGSGGVKVTVKNSFGKVILGEATEEEMKDKAKSKRSITS
ncbi:DUF4097 family beta strand repeat-containing protein [Ferruginibacter sp.]